MTVEKRRINLRSIGISSGLTGVMIVGLFIGFIKWVGKAFAVPKIAAIAVCVDSTNHIPILKRIETIETKQTRNDTNLAIIKTYLEVMASGDQKMEVQNRLSNPTGIH